MQKGSMDNSYICVSECMAGTYLSVVSNVSYCRECTDFRSACLVCLNNSTCLICSSGFNLFYNSTNNSTTCVSDCPIAYYSTSGSCLPCIDSTCRTCVLSSTLGFRCESCISGMYFIQSVGKCVPKCLSGYYALNTSNTLSCVQCSDNCQNCLSSN